MRVKEKGKEKSTIFFRIYFSNKNLIVHFLKSIFLLIMNDSKYIDKKVIFYALGKVQKNSENIFNVLQKIKKVHIKRAMHTDGMTAKILSPAGFAPTNCSSLG